jgi:hypothetical protein
MHSIRRLSYWAVLGASLAVNGVQGTRIFALEDALNQANTRVLSEGTVVEKLLVNDTAGKPKIIDYSSSVLPTVIYVFRPDCIWCERNSESINSLAKQLAGRYRVIGLSLSVDGLDEFAKEYHSAFPIYRDISQSSIVNYHLQSTPETIVVSTSGRVIKSWRGAYVGSIKSTIEQFFSIRIPAV